MYWCIFVVQFLACLNPAVSMSVLQPMYYGEPEDDIASMIFSKGYLPNENDILQAKVPNSNGNDATYLLSRLSDKDLVNLLANQPKRTEFDLIEIFNSAFNQKTEKVGKDKKRFQSVTSVPVDAYFKLENKKVDPYSHSPKSNLLDTAIHNINNLLYSRQVSVDNYDVEGLDDAKRELLFDALVAQLKTLCCKSSRSKKNGNSPLKENVPANYESNRSQGAGSPYMFLVLNDEVKGDASDDLVYVDPNSLNKNTSVLLLGPVSSPLTDNQLKVVMDRILGELSKPEYVPLLQQIADGSVNTSNLKLMKNLIKGPDTRRYIKPHRCNHQSKLAKVYGGPKWLICTGYLNLNTPSLYD